MKFGIFDHMDRSGPDAGRQYEERLKLIQLFEWAGFHSYHVAEHHSTPLGMAPSPSVFLAAVAQRTRTLRFGPLVYTLNLYHPLRLIDEICMLDQMSGGRLELGVGKGVSPYEVKYYGVDPATGTERFEEILKIVLKGLAESRLTHHGKHFTFEDVPVELKPVQYPHPPLWYGTRNFDSAHRLAKLGANAVVSLTARDAGEFSARYRGAWQALGRDLDDLPFIGMTRHVFVGDTDREARATAKRAFNVWYNCLAHLGRAHGVATPQQIFPPEFEDAEEGGFLIAGSASTVRDRMRKDNATAGINYSLCRLAFGDLSFEEAAHSTELMAKEVMPDLGAEKPATAGAIAGFIGSAAYAARGEMATKRVAPSR